VLRKMDSNFRFRMPCKGAKAVIVGFGCMPPSLDYLRLPSVDISEGGPKRIFGTEALSRAEPRNRKFESISLHRRVGCEPAQNPSAARAARARVITLA
jgi:hypothetical protein